MMGSSHFDIVFNLRIIIIIFLSFAVDKKTISQSILTKEERSKLPYGIFQCTSRAENMRILLVDDVTTTGSTIERAANALLDTSPSQIDVLCLMRSE